MKLDIFDHLYFDDYKKILFYKKQKEDGKYVFIKTLNPKLVEEFKMLKILTGFTLKTSCVDATYETPEIKYLMEHGMEIQIDNEKNEIRFYYTKDIIKKLYINQKLEGNF